MRGDVISSAQTAFVKFVEPLVWLGLTMPGAAMLFGGAFPKVQAMIFPDGLADWMRWPIAAAWLAAGLLMVYAGIGLKRVAIDGDVPCVPGFRSFSWDAARLDARIRAALAAAGQSAFPEEGVTLVGYSQGAALAEQLVQRWPARYTRLVLIGAPTDPSPSHFRTAKGVVTMSCSLDVPWRMTEAARGIARAGVPSRYVEMPGCTHGNIGKGDETLGAAFDFLRGDS